MKKKCILNNPDYPPKVDKDNWRLSEYFYEHDLGMKTKTSFTLDESLNRSGADQGAVASMVSLEEEKKLGKKDPKEKHRQSISRVTNLAAKLGKNIGAAETSLPSLKRKLPEGGFQSLKEGLDRCRQCRCNVLEELEDLKPLPEQVDDQELAVEKLGVLQQDLIEHLDALRDAMQQASPAQPVVKAQPATPSHAADDDDRFTNRN